MSSKRQLGKNTSDYCVSAGGDNINATVRVDTNDVAQVGTLACASQPTAGDSFLLGQMRYRFVSTAGDAYDRTGEFWPILLGANVSATVSAISAAINLTANLDTESGMIVGRTGAGPTAATAAGAKIDLTVTATNNPIEFKNMGGSTLSWADTTARLAGQPLPEGFIGYITSAGNLVEVSDPAEYTRMQVRYPSKPN